MANLLSTKPYKGTRDFYPEEMRFRTAMFQKLSETVESFAFEKIDAPLVEPIDMYLAKTSEEIVGQQIYSFKDRGDRHVAIRPEMTPTVSRMVAAKIRELPKPIRWYSLPNLWRYEQPGKGRLREHWQLNCDIFGASSQLWSNVEILELAIAIPVAFGADASMFQVYVNHRDLINLFFEETLKLKKENWPALARILDKRAKVSREAYESMLQEISLSKDQVAEIDAFLEAGFDELKKYSENQEVANFLNMLGILFDMGYKEYIKFDPSVVRGFDYYTGLVFEVFDAHPENKRSLFGGGRYNNLIGAFSKEALDAVGFGMGDVTFAQFLLNHNLLQTPKRNTHAYVAMFPNEEINSVVLAKKLRREGLNIEVASGAAKLGKQFQEAEKKRIKFVLLQGQMEKEKSLVQVKDLKKGESKTMPFSELSKFLKEFH